MRGSSRRLPHWLSRPIPAAGKRREVYRTLAEDGLETICENARCPNKNECYGAGTATFMILGKICTRGCGFCAVSSGAPSEPDPREPEAVARAVDRMGLDYAVVTSVTRDDLDDGGASQFAATVKAIRTLRPACRVEVLTPDFDGVSVAVETVVRARPGVYNHNLETVPRLYEKVRPKADFERSVDLLAEVKELDPSMTTKSGLMLGLGEDMEELTAVLARLRQVRCDAVTIGQYLAPEGCLPVERYVPPHEFAELGVLARHMGFEKVASGPLVRSSYRAAEMAPARQPTEGSA